MWTVYVLQSAKDGGFYIGCTNNLSRRLEEHNQGRNKSTKSRVPLNPVYVEEHKDRSKAYAREKVLKSYKGGEALKKLIGVGTEVVKRGRL